MSGIVWEDPPAPTSGSRSSTQHAAIAAELRRNPGKWAKVGTAAAQMTRHINNGTVAAYRPGGSFEAVSRNSRKVDGRKSPIADIYARYVGEAS